MKITTKIKVFFDFIEQKNNIRLKNNEEYPVQGVKIADENGYFRTVPYIIKKQDTITTITVDDSIIKTANNHKISFDGVKCKNVSDMVIGDKIFKNKKEVKITDIKRDETIEDVYDLMIDTENHLYMTADGVVHHNTTIITDISAKYNLNQITIDASTLNADDSTGLTTPTGEGKNLTTEFSEPPLYTQIMNEYDATKLPEEGSKYTHILFIDEISRTSTKVFNSIRSLMLDKKVGSLKIPDNVMIIAAMNPTDKGATELSDHFKDVVDIIDSEANFASVMAYLEGQKTNKSINDKIGFDITGISIDILKQMVERFESTEDVDGDDIDDLNKRKFFWTDGFNTFYISAREFDSAISGCILDSYNMIKIKKRFSIDKQYNDEEVAEFGKIIEKVMLDKYRKVLGFIAQDKGEMENTDFEKIMIGVEDIIGSNMYRITDGFSSVKSEALQSVKSMFEGANYDVDMLLNYDGIVPILEKSISDSDTNTFIDDVSEILDYYVNFDDIMKSFDDMIGLWKLLSMVDWSEFNGEITANISEQFLERGFKPVLRYAVEQDGDALAQHGDNEDLQRYPGLNDIIIDRASTNKHNMFVNV